MKLKRMDKFAVNKLLISICACWASVDQELGLPVNAQLRLMDSLTLAWSVLILCTSLLKFFSLNLGLDVTRGATFKSSAEPTRMDLLTINYLPRINEFEKLYYGLVSVSIGTSLFWRLYLRFYRTSKRAQRTRADPTRRLDAKCSLMRFFFAGPTAGGLAGCGGSRPQASDGSQASSINRSRTSVSQHNRQHGDDDDDAETRARASLAPSSQMKHANGGGDHQHSHLDWVKLYECRAVRRDLLAGCSGSQELLIRSNNQDLEHDDDDDHPASSRQQQGRRRRRRQGCPTGPLSTLHTGESYWRAKQHQQLQLQQRRRRRDTTNTISKLSVPAAAAAAAAASSSAAANQAIEPRRSDVFTNPVRSGNFLSAADSSWARWHYIARNLRYVMAFILISTIPIMYYTIDGLHAVMRNFSYDRLDNKLKTALYYYGIMEQVYACTQAALFFIFTNVFITIFHADIQFKIKTIKRDLKNLNGSFRSATPRSRPPKMLIYYQQFRLWAFFDHIQQLDTFVRKYSLVSMAAFIIGISFGQSFLKVQEYSLKTGTAAVLLANFLSFTFLYVISWDIERRSERLHSTLLTIAARDYDFLIKRLWLKTLFGFFERDGRRTFTLDSMYPLNLHSYFKTIFGWLTMSLLINRLFHKRSWDTTFET